jgi:hypothetical protein
LRSVSDGFSEGLTGHYSKLAEQIRQFLVDEQDHQIVLATALGVEVPNVSGSKK